MCQLVYAELNCTVYTSSLYEITYTYIWMITHDSLPETFCVETCRHQADKGLGQLLEGLAIELASAALYLG